MTQEPQFKFDKRFEDDLRKASGNQTEPSFQQAMNQAAGDPNPLDSLITRMFDKLNDMELKGRLTRNEVIASRRMLNYGKRYGIWFCVEQVYEHLRLSVSFEGKGREEGVAMARASAEAAEAQARAKEVRI